MTRGTPAQGRFALTIAALTALAASAAYSWRSRFLEHGAGGDTATGFLPTLQGLAPTLWLDLALLHTLVLLLIAARAAALALRSRGRRRLAAGLWWLGLSGIGAAVLWVFFVRIFDTVYFYYSSNHIDAILLRHAHGSAMKMVPNNEMLRYIGIASGVGVAHAALLVLVARQLARSAPPVLRARARTVLATFVLCSLVAFGAARLAPSGLTPERARIATAFPEFEVIRLLTTGADDQSAATASSGLDPVVVDKLRRFGLTIDPDAEYPLVRDRIYDAPFPYPKRVGAAERPNVIVLFFEGFGAALTSVYDDSTFPGLTPNLEELARRGHVVSGLYNASVPTLAGLVCTLCSHLPTTELVEWQQAMQKRFQCLPHVLARFGYDTTYVHQVENEYIHTGEVMRRAGFARVLGRDEVAEQFHEEPQSWGFSDRQMFRFLARWLDRGEFGEPFLLGMKTLDSHPPFNHSTDTLPYRDGKEPLLDTVHTADLAFGSFWKWFQQSRFKDNTIVVALADHTMFPGIEYRRLREPEDVFRRFFDEILFVIHDPTRDMVGRSHVLSSQVDVAPTILHMLDINVPNHFEGLSLFEARLEYPAVIGMSRELFFVNEPNGDGRSVMQFALSEILPACRNAASDPLTPTLTQCEYYQFYRFKQSLLQNDRIWPEDSSVHVRPRAPAGRSTPRQGVGELLAQLRASDTDLRAAAADSLGEHGSAAAEAAPQLAALVTQDASEAVRTAAARALGRIGIVADGVEALRHALADSNVFVRRAALRALAALGRQQGLERMLEDPDARVRLAALAALQDLHLGDPAELPRLETLADSDDGGVRWVAIEAIGELGEAKIRAVPLLARKLEDSDIRVRAAAATALGEVGPKALPAIAPLLDSADSQTKLSALYAIGRIKMDAVGFLPRVARLAADPDPTVRAVVPHILIFLDPRGAQCVPTLSGMLEDDDDAVRASTVRAMGEALALRGPDMPAAIPILTRMLGQPEVRPDALRVFRNVAEVAAPAAEAISSYVDDPDPVVRGLAHDALGRIGPAAAHVAPALIARLSCEDAAVRLRATDTLSAIAAADPASRAALTDLLDDPVESVRVRAAQVLREIEKR